MRLRYILDEFDSSTCDAISNRLRSELIPHLLEEKALLIDVANEDAVELILTEFGQINSEPESFGVDSGVGRAAPPPPPPPPPRLDMVKYSSTASQIRSQNFSETEDAAGGIALIGALIGGGFGVAVVVAALTDPTYEGTVYLFLPAIIFAVVGFWLGSGIENLIRRTRKKP